MGKRRARTLLGCLLAVGAALVGSVGLAQAPGLVQPDATPVNDGPNPYQVIPNWAELKEKRPWGGSNGVAVAPDGTIWATDRCSSGSTPGCLNSTGNPIHHFDASGKEIISFGAGLFVWPHGIFVDKDGNVWVADSREPTTEERAASASAARKGSAVMKFSPEGKLLLTLGTPGVKGDPPGALTEPTAVITDPTNGDVYVAESHTDVTDPKLVGRVSVFDKTGKFLRAIGRAGTGPGEFRTPHALAFDSQGRLVVADRHNHRIQILTKSGQYVSECHAFGRTSGLVLDAYDNVYTTDSESTAKVHPGWLRGLRIGSLKDCKVAAFIPAHPAPTPEGAMGEGIARDAKGNLYTAEANLMGVWKYVPK